MDSVIVSDFGVMLAKKGDRLIVRGPRPRLELIEGGPQLFLPLGIDARRPTLTVVTPQGEKTPPPPLREAKPAADGTRPPKPTPDAIELPLFRIGEIVIASSGISLSSDLVEACCERGIRLSFLTRSGKPYAMLSSPMLTATVITRREQLAAYNDRRGVELAIAIVRGKLGNQAALLKYFAKYLKVTNPEAFAAISEVTRSLVNGRSQARKVDGERIDDARETLLSIEGVAGRNYWSGVRMLLPEGALGPREHRGAVDPVNSALNYGYGILYTQVWGAIMNAGLEPFAGFMHVDRPGKPSLVLDLVEEFRQPIVDRAIIAAIGRGTSLETKEGMLTDSSRRAIAAAVLERLDGEVEFRGQRHKLKSVVQIQARNVASFLRGESTYRAFAFKW